MEQVWQKINELRQTYPILGETSTPIDVFSFFELEANEFAGRLLVPLLRIQEMYDTFAERAKALVTNFQRNEQLRTQFAEQIAPKFGVNTQVITTRLDRDGIWPSA